MPRISEFYGIVIWMYHNDHDPPHFHAEYGEFMARIAIESGDALDGPLPTRAMRLVQEWAHLLHDQLLVNWEKPAHPPRSIESNPLP